MFTSFFWASCIPSTCNHLDHQQIVKSQFKDFFNGTSIDIRIQSHEKLCQTQSEDVTVDSISRGVVWDEIIFALPRLTFCTRASSQIFFHRAFRWDFFCDCVRSGSDLRKQWVSQTMACQRIIDDIAGYRRQCSDVIFIDEKLEGAGDNGRF